MRIICITVLINLFFLSPVLSANVVQIGGTGAALGTMHHLASAFEKNRPEVKVNIWKSIGSSGGIKAVIEGELDIGLSARQLYSEERSQNVISGKYGMTALVIISHPDMNLYSITDDELMRIYKGEMTHLEDGERVRPILRPPQETDIFIIKKFSLEMRKAMEHAYERKGLLVATTDQENVDIIERVRGAIGFSTLAQVTSEHRNVNVMAFNGITPGIKTISDLTYPLTRSFYLVTQKKISKEAEKFISFLYSIEGRAILESSGYLVLMSEPLLNNEN